MILALSENSFTAKNYESWDIPSINGHVTIRFSKDGYQPQLQHSSVVLK